MRIPIVAAALLLPVAALAGNVEDNAMQVTSRAFDANGSIPRKYTCQGGDISPPLAWAGVPEGTRTLALIMDDPDAPDPAHPTMTWVHWVVFNLPPHAGGLREDASGSLPDPAMEGVNSWKRTDYGGPCPPTGRHRYFHKLYALDTSLDLKDPDKDALLKAMEGHVLGKAELIGTYEKE